MFPIRDEIPSRRAPVVTLAILAANVAVFLYQWTLPEDALLSFVYRFGLVPARISDPAWALSVGFPSAGYSSVLTSMFLHGGLLHLASNMWSLWIFGDNIEDRMGRTRFLFFYLACGVAAGWVHWLTNPGSTVPTVGASGAISGVMGAYLVLYPRVRVNMLFIFIIFFRVIAIPAWLVLLWWFALQVLTGLPQLMPMRPEISGGVAVWAHVGGFVAGVVLIKLFEDRRLVAKRDAIREIEHPHGVPSGLPRW